MDGQNSYRYTASALHAARQKVANQAVSTLGIDSVRISFLEISQGPVPPSETFILPTDL